MPPSCKFTLDNYKLVGLRCICLKAFAITQDATDSCLDKKLNERVRTQSS